MKEIAEVISYLNYYLIIFLNRELIRGKASPKGQEALYKKWATLEVCVSSFPLKLREEEDDDHRLE